MAPITATCKRVQGEGRERKKERKKQTQASVARARSPIPKPWLWGCDECGDLSSCHSPHPHPHPGLPEQRAAPKCSAQPGRGWPPLSRAELLGKGSCWWQAGACVSKPTVSKPSQRMRWQQEAPSPGGMLNQRSRGDGNSPLRCMQFTGLATLPQRGDTLRCGARGGWLCSR